MWQASSGSVTASARERKAKRTAEALKSAKERVQSASTLLFQLQANNVRRPELYVQLEATAADLQTALQRLATVEGERKDAIEQLQASRRRSGSQVSPRQAQTPWPGATASSSALLQDQLERASKATEAAVFRAADAEARIGALSAELQAARHAEQELKLDLQGVKAATEKAAASGHKHQAAVAQLTGDNLVLVLRAKAAEDEVTALKKEREELRAAIDEQRGPWFDEVRAGVRQKVAAALEQAEALEARIDSKQAEHDRALTAINEEKCGLQRKLAEAQIASHNLGLDLQAAQQKAARQEPNL
ncbi:g5005 [Coccomyxa viridis]|uniref:G5005 protein n=1 Tax=Coccomyxa viridis TaxID=1274662 RepID=A0ABP1FT51_9CHLO